MLVQGSEPNKFMKIILKMPQIVQVFLCLYKFTPRKALAFICSCLAISLVSESNTFNKLCLSSRLASALEFIDSHRRGESERPISPHLKRTYKEYNIYPCTDRRNKCHTSISISCFAKVSCSLCWLATVLGWW